MPAELLAATAQALAGVSGVRAIPISDEWDGRAGLLRDHPATMWSWAWHTPLLRWLRVALLDGGEHAQIFSALALPDPRIAAPLFGAEVVVISGSVTVVALDWITPLPALQLDGTELPAIRSRFDRFPAGGELPDWAAHSFSPYALFSRPRGAVPDHTILAAYRAYFEGYLRCCTAAMPTADPDAMLAAQRRYCSEHFRNDPGGAMLAKIFGAAWADAYAREFLFRLAPEPPVDDSPDGPTLHGNSTKE